MPHNIMDELLGYDYLDFAVDSTISRMNDYGDNPNNMNPTSQYYERYYSRSYGPMGYNPNYMNHPQMQQPGIHPHGNFLDSNPELAMVSLHRAIDCNDMHLLNRLLNFFKLPRVMGYEMIRMSARRNNLVAIQILVDHGYSVNRPRESCTDVPAPIHFAIKYNNRDLLGYLVSIGADVNVRFDGTERDFGDNSSLKASR